jgi:hypothetical protein
MWLSKMKCIAAASLYSPARKLRTAITKNPTGRAIRAVEGPRCVSDESTHESKDKRKEKENVHRCDESSAQYTRPVLFFLYVPEQRSSA